MGKFKHGRHLPAFVLLCLAECPAYGLTILNQLQERMPTFSADGAAIYRCLQELEKASAVTSYWDTTVPGPARKWYTLTDAGWHLLSDYQRDIEARKENLEYFLKQFDHVKADRRD